MNEELKKKIGNKLWKLECDACEIRDLTSDNTAWDILDGLYQSICEAREQIDELEED